MVDFEVMKARHGQCVSFVQQFLGCSILAQLASNLSESRHIFGVSKTGQSDNADGWFALMDIVLGFQLSYHTLQHLRTDY